MVRLKTPFKRFKKSVIINSTCGSKPNDDGRESTVCTKAPFGSHFFVNGYIIYYFFIQYFKIKNGKKTKKYENIKKIPF